MLSSLLGWEFYFRGYNPKEITNKTKPSLLYKGTCHFIISNHWKLERSQVSKTMEWQTDLWYDNKLLRLPGMVLISNIWSHCLHLFIYTQSDHMSSLSRGMWPLCDHVILFWWSITTKIMTICSTGLIHGKWIKCFMRKTKQESPYIHYTM